MTLNTENENPYLIDKKYTAAEATEGKNENFVDGINNIVSSGNEIANKDNNNNDVKIPDNQTNKNVKKSFQERWFSKILPDSMRGSIMNLSILALGTGCLSLPAKMDEMSLLSGVVSIIVVGFASNWTLSLLAFCSTKENIYDYTFLVTKIYGTWLGKILDFFIFFYIFGQICVYQVISKLLNHFVF